MGQFFAIRFSDGLGSVASFVEVPRAIEHQRGYKIVTADSYEEACEKLNSLYMEDDYADKRVSIYTDGSCKDWGCQVLAGWAWVAYKNGVQFDSDRGVIEYAISRNIDGETAAVLAALREAKVNNWYVHLYHDYTGIAKWAHGEWTANGAVGRRYVQGLERIGLAEDQVRFHFVRGHSKVVGNDKADKLAAKAIAEFIEKHPIAHLWE